MPRARTNVANAESRRLRRVAEEGVLDVVYVEEVEHSLRLVLAEARVPLLHAKAALWNLYHEVDEAFDDLPWYGRSNQSR